jgi:transposase
MSEKEIMRYDIIQSLISGRVNATDASKQIGVTIRQIQRLKDQVDKNGIEGLIHKGRGNGSNRKINPEIIKKVKELLKEKYYDFGPTFAAEKLYEDDNVKIGKETIRAIMTNLQLWKPKPRKKGKVKRAWRARKDNFGEMQQFDGSYHIWFGLDEYCLLLSVDDATGRITHAVFDINESTVAVFKFWLGYFKKSGLPLSIYLDKFSTYKINHKNAVDNKDMITQFQRAMNQLGIKPITAHSAEAKGRVERMFETLQDRLVKELRLKGITTIVEANIFLEEYIPKFNAKFAVVPNRRNNLHKKINKHTEEKLPQIFSIQNTRIVNNDYTIMFKTQFFQLEKRQPTTVYKKDAVMVEEHLDGSIKLKLRDNYLNYFVLPERPKKEIDIKLPALTSQEQTHYKPPVNHPWRRPFQLNKREIKTTNFN